jgi:dimethylhistidine N-methyltransferase
MKKELLGGLLASKKTISPKFLYDERGSKLFEEICTLDEYYPSRAEIEILSTHSRAIAQWIGEDAILIEPGCGNCRKVEIILRTLSQPRAYVALDISKKFLEETTSQLQKKHQEIPIFPVVADYTRDLILPPELENTNQKRVVFFPGSTIGNLEPSDAKKLLREMGILIKRCGGLLIGVDLKKESEVLERAYDDSKGVSAEFNYNLLDRLNREFDGSFDRSKFKYVARYNAQAGRMEMGLVSLVPQKVDLAGSTIQLSEDEAIHTESSYKYTPQEFISMADECGYEIKTYWMDAFKRFCVYYFETR